MVVRKCYCFTKISMHYRGTFEKQLNTISVENKKNYNELPVLGKDLESTLAKNILKS